MATKKCPSCPIVEVCIQSATQAPCPLDPGTNSTTNTTTITKEK